MIPSVSVIMPVCNCQRYLQEAVNSILAQTFGDFEFLIVDDGSTDGSLAILRKMAQRESRIRVISRANTGQTKALIELVNEARGEFIARMDADDCSLPDRFEHQLAFLGTHPQVVALGGEVEWMDKDGDPIRNFCVGHTHDEIDAAQMNGVGAVITHPAAMFRRQAVLAIGGYRAELQPAEDCDLFLRLAEYGKLANLDRVVLRYRIHPNSTGGRQRALQNQMKYRALAEAHQRRGLDFRETPPPAEPEQKPGDSERLWAWWALEAGNVPIARKLAWESLRQSPLIPESWRAMACAIRGR
jgi:glycosyltransferase involved in cell wall biosynthesis